MKFTPPLSTPIADPVTEAMRRNVDQRLRELQSQPAIGATVIRNVELPDGVEVTVNHGLGRDPLAVVPTAIRGSGFTAGVIHDRGLALGSGATIDRSKVVVLRAVSFTTTITVDVVLM